MVGVSLFVMATGALMPFFESALHLTQAQLGIILSVEMIGLSVAMTSIAASAYRSVRDTAVVFWSGAVMGGSLLAAAIIQNYIWLIAWLRCTALGLPR